MKRVVLMASVLWSALAMQPLRAEEAAPAEAAAPVDAVAAEAAAPVDASVAEPAPAASVYQVPRLVITWDCGDCEHNDKVIPLIEQAYAAEAEKNSFSLSETEVAEAAITDIRQRPPGARVMFGIMAGKDRLTMRIRYQGQEVSVSDTSANAIQGMNNLSADVGKRAYAEMAARAH